MTESVPRTMVYWCTAAVLSHLLISVFHGYAHSELGVGLSTWQSTYVTIVITLTPLVAVLLLWMHKSRLGLLLLFAAMTGSLLFGVYYHYVAISPDHVGHLPPGETQGLFKSTALLLGLTEGFAVVIAFLGLRRIRNQS